MEVIYTLIPGMLMFGLILVGVLVWAVKKGQYEDFEGDGQRILMDDDEPATGEHKVSIGKNFPDAED
ncbi:MAG TPA: cbb3-type cytochrome oxidase assembly protein CcoS [Gammaproteobacteria bacterium]